MIRSLATKPLTGHMVLAMVLVFFGVVIGVNVLMMTLAVKTLSGTDVDSAYQAGLAYEGEIRAAQVQDQRRWRIDAHIERRSGGAAALRVEARDSDGVPLTGLEFSGRLQRPADKRDDKSIALTDVGQGIYRGSASGVAAGQWDLVLEGERTGQRVFLSKNRIVLN